MPPPSAAYGVSAGFVPCQLRGRGVRSPLPRTPSPKNCTPRINLCIGVQNWRLVLLGQRLLLARGGPCVSCPSGTKRKFCNPLLFAHRLLTKGTHSRRRALLPILGGKSAALSTTSHPICQGGSIFASLRSAKISTLTLDKSAVWRNRLLKGCLRHPLTKKW